MTFTRPPVFALAALLLLCACNRPTEAPTAEPLPQFGTPLADRADAVATDPQRGAVYVASVEAIPTAAEEPYERGGTLFLRRYNRSGDLIWQKRLLSTSADPYVVGLHTDALGNLYLGWSLGSSDGPQGAALLKFGPAGRQLYRVDLDNALRDAEGSAAGNLYVSGYEGRDNGDTQRDYVRAYNAQGALMWERTRVYGDLGEPVSGSDVPVPYSLSPAADGSLYVRGRLNGGNVLTKYSRTGNALWTQPLPQTFFDAAVGAVGDDVYLVNRREGQGRSDNLTVLKYDASGKRRLTQTLTGTEAIYPQAIRADSKGYLYLVGRVSRGDWDLFVRKYTPALKTLWTYAPRLTGTLEAAAELTLEDERSVFLVGETTSRVNGKNYGDRDAFLIRLTPQGQRVWSR